MRKELLTLGMIFLPAVALAAPDFNGSWALNAADSDRIPSAMWMTRAAQGGGGGGRGPGQVIMTVHQDAKNLQVTDSQNPPREYALDGTAHTKPTDTGITKEQVTAKLQGDNLEIDTTQPYGGMPGNATLKTKEVWSLSPDGKTLTIVTTRDVPARQQTFKQVYNKTQTAPAALCSAGCVAPSN